MSVHHHCHWISSDYSPCHLRLRIKMLRKTFPKLLLFSTVDSDIICSLCSSSVLFSVRNLHHNLSVQRRIKGKSFSVQRKTFFFRNKISSKLHQKLMQGKFMLFHYFFRDHRQTMMRREKTLIGMCARTHNKLKSKKNEARELRSLDIWLWALKIRLRAFCVLLQKSECEHLLVGFHRENWNVLDLTDLGWTTPARVFSNWNVFGYTLCVHFSLSFEWSS